MKLDLIQPNAHYDMEHGTPAVLEHDNDGSHIYRFNIAHEMGVDEETEEEKQIGFSCVEVRTFKTPTKANLKKEIIRHFVDESAEFDLVNSYNKHILGITKDEKAVVDYKEYLQFTEDLDAMLLTDLSN